MARRLDNLYAGIPAALPDELTTALWRCGETRIERIVSRGHRSPEGFWYDQAEDECVVVLEGEARLEFDDGRVMMLRRGDGCVLPAGCRHRVAWTAPDVETIWLAVFCRPTASGAHDGP